MESKIIEVDNIAKKYQLGLTGSGSLYETFSDGVKRILGKGPKNRKEEFWALKDISFSLEQGDILGIVGRNGAGKSTLLKVLSRITPPTKGKITINGRIASLLEVGTGFHPELSGRENIYLNGAILGMTKEEIRRKYDEIVDFSGVEKFLETPVKRYSSGMFVRLAFAVAAHLEPEILVIDEVLAVGDAEFQKKCLGKMDSVAKSGRTILFVSHNMAAVKNLCTKGMYLKQGEVQLIGGIDEVVNQYLITGGQNTKRYENNVLSFVQVEQIKYEIQLTCHYEHTEEIDLPMFGFVFYSMEGIPIMGTNPLSNEHVHFDRTKKYPQKGKVVATIRNPKLMDGTYNISIWFGNSMHTIFEDRDCLQIEVIGMTRNKQMNVSRVGHVSPDCIYEFSED